MDIALLGHGTVGRGVDEICAKLDGVDVTRILELPDRLTDERMTSNFQDILDDPDITLVLECMGGLEPAHTFIADALAAGKSVVTSNKAVVAHYLQEFVELAHTTGSQLICEAAVGGGVPWLSSIRQVRRIDEISSVSGIMNGTTNFILDAMRTGDADFAETLAEAQRLGYAERDPSADIDGIDVANKVVISTLAAFDALTTVDQIPVTGIRHFSKTDEETFKAHGRTVKLIGRAVREGDRFACAVEPVAMPDFTVEASIPSNFNILSLDAETVGPLKFYGQGAGSLPTGNAMVQDVLDYREGKRPAFRIDPDLIWDATLLTGDYVIRTTANLPVDGKVYGANARLIEGINAEEAYALLTTARETDSEAMIFARPRKALFK